MNIAMLERRLLQAEQAIGRIDRPPPAWPTPGDLAVAAGLDPDAWQRDFLTARPHRGLLNCSRQSGKSTTSAALADEAARISNDLFTSVLPMLAVSDGDFIGLSTPFGRRGWWADAYLSGGDTWQRWEIPATACPRISAAFLTEAERTVGSWWFQQEFLCQFLDSQTQVFTGTEIDMMFAEEVSTWNL